MQITHKHISSWPFQAVRWSFVCSLLRAEVQPTLDLSDETI